MLAAVVDNTSPDIEYSGQWSFNDTAPQTDYNQTTAYSTGPDSSFRFKFNGTWVQVRGSLIPHIISSAAYTLDGGRPTFFTSANSSTYFSQRVFYTSDIVPYGEHTLVVTPASSISYCFDNIIYTPGPYDVAPTAVMTTLPVYSYSYSNSRGRPDLRVLLPAVILPCIAVLAALLAAVFFMRYRRRSRFIELEDVPYTPTTPYSPTRLSSLAKVELPEKALSADGYHVVPTQAHFDSDAPPTYSAL
ncbi:hypothetical protein PsYK624_012290 [Phanerochaete sordida]|uniref:Uncharacterized protein n=1 Tax=Phanerochaete sordida TaxID=48140 RepID=A0A9P3L7K0_9APHY|nr:hypothetical protein PsYK624_012290 [Phanerochaete sordida]